MIHAASISRHALFLICVLFFSSLIATGCGGCDSGDEDKKVATVAITSVDPAGAYANVPVTVTFEITPGANTTNEDLKWQVNFGDGQTSGGDLNNLTATNTYAQSGTYTIVVQALAGSDVVGSATQAYTIYDDVELSISGVSGRPANAKTGDMLNVEATVKNELAGDVQTPIEVSAYLSKEQNVTAADIGSFIELGARTVTSDIEGEPTISSGDEKRITVSSVIADTIQSGDYYVVVILDPQNKLADSDRSNNFAVSSSIVRIDNNNQTIADLIVRDVVAAPDRAFPELSRVTRGYTISNPGGLDVFDVIVKTYLSRGDKILDDQDTLINTSEPFNVLSKDTTTIPAETFVLDQAITPPDDQDLEIYVIVTAAPSIDQEEADKDNNTASTENPITVSNQLVNGPDVVVKSFAITPESTFLDGTLTVQATIANEGTIDVGSFFCSLYLGQDNRINTDLDQRFTNVLISGLKSGEEIVVDEAKEVPSIYDPGTYYIYMVCDPMGALNETFRSNNQAIHPNPVTITDQADVDLTVDSLTGPKDVNEGEMFTLTAKFCVTGTNPSGQTRATLYKTPGNRVDFNAEPILTVNVPNINPNECADVEIMLEADCEQFKERYAYGIVADSDDVLPELDEDNNARTANDLVTVAGAFCACNEDMFEPNNRAVDAKDLTVGQTAGALCDAGTCDFYKVSVKANDSLIIQNDFDPARGVLVTTLYDGSGVNVVDVDRQAQPQQVARFLSPADEDYIVSVCGSQTLTRNLYNLDIQVIPQSATVDVIPQRLTFPVRDSYSIGARIDTSFKIYNLGQQSTGAFDAQLFISTNDVIGDADDVVLQTLPIADIASGGIRDVNETITLPTNLMDGDYYLGVTLDPTAQLTESDTANNSILSTKLTIVTRCYDALEPNDSFQDAWKINASGSYSNLIACNEADDFYEICVEDGKKFTVTLAFNDMMGDLDLELFDQQLQGIASSANAGINNEQVSVPYVNGAQCYYAQVKLKSIQQMVENTYSLDVNIQDVDPSLRCDSYGEPNNGFTTASSLLAATQAMVIDRCPVADTDYFYIDLNAGQRVTFRATKTPSNQGGTLRIQLYNTNQTPGQNQETAPDQPTAEIKDFLVPLTGRYYVQVTVSGNARNVRYELEVDGLAGTDLEPRNFVIGPGSYKTGDQIRFGFDLVNLGSTATMAAPNYEIFIGSNPVHDPNTDVSAGTFSAPMAIGGNTTLPIADQTLVPANVMIGMQFLHIVVDDAGDNNAANNAISIPINIIP